MSEMKIELNTMPFTHALKTLTFAKNIHEVERVNFHVEEHDL